MRYATVEYKKCEEIKKMIKTLTDTEIAEPEELTKIKNKKVREKVFDEKIKSYIQKQEVYDENKSKLRDVIWDQCSGVLQTKLESDTEYLKMIGDSDCAKLLRKIKKLMHHQDGNNYTPINIYKAKLGSLICCQGKKETVNRYYNRMKNLIEILVYDDYTHGDKIGMVHFAMKYNESEYRQTYMSQETASLMIIVKKLGNVSGLRFLLSIYVSKSLEV